MDSLDRLIEEIEHAPTIRYYDVTWREAAAIEKPYLAHLLKEIAEEVKDMIHLPVDRDDMAVRVDDRVHLKHNGMDRRVTSLMYTGDGEWIVGCDEDGGFILPESKDNVTHVTVDTILGEFYKEATEAQYTTDGLKRIVRKYADRLQLKEPSND